MPGYLLIEENMMQPNRPRGFAPNPVRMGILDYLRELRQETFPFNAEQKIMVVGLEDVLLAAERRGELREIAGFVHDTMVSRANELNAEIGWVQVVFRRPLRRMDDFWFDKGGGQRISLAPIFGKPILNDQSGNECYQVGFNLT